MSKKKYGNGEHEGETLFQQLSTPHDALPEDSVADYVASLRESERLGDQVVYHHVVQPQEAAHAPNARPWPKAVQELLRAKGIDELYTHQARAADMVRMGRNVVVATPTASGKTLVYTLPIVERFLQDPECRALCLFPLKALAQDQFKNLEALLEPWPKDARPTAAIYDGDISDYRRRKVRQDPPNILLTNPEMLHLSLCPHHETWSAFLAGLNFIVLDEVHTYRGVLGSHMAQVLRRLLRLCRRYGANPTFIFCSATVANPAELARQLTGLEVEAVTETGAPQGKRHFVFLNPYEGAAQAAIMLLQAALHRGLRTIIYAQSRKVTELISLWAQQRSGPYKERISAYRAGYLPEERREIEEKMSSGELLAVVSTSALELGIDIGALDICILVGYPGSVMSTMQRGGRVGRSMRESAVALVAHEDALDQYFMRCPQAFFEQGAEAAVLNPYNEVILARHLECAAAEAPLRADEPWMQDPLIAPTLARMENSGQLLRSADGREIYSRRKRPQRDISLRGTGSTYSIEIGNAPASDVEQSALSVGTIDEHRAFKETHTGAVYLHKGQSFVVHDMDTTTRTVRVKPQRVDYFTRARGNKVTEIMEVYAEKPAWGTRLHLGRLKVTETVTGYETRRIRGNKLLRITPLDLPPLVFETEGIWFAMPMDLIRACERDFMHFMGGIHAMEHASIGILPLLVMTDRNDLGGISTPMHGQLGLPAVFIYDGIPGGVGLTREAYEKGEELLEKTLMAISTCECEQGCPGCVHSPKCGSGNRPIDKAASMYVLRYLKNAPPMPGPLDIFMEAQEPPEPPTVHAVQAENSQHPEVSRETIKDEATHEVPMPVQSSKRVVQPLPAYGVLDVETRRSAQEVGGWNKAERMGVSVAVLYDSRADAYIHYLEDDMPQMMERLKTFDLLVGFNIKRFDYRVLSAYAPLPFLTSLPTLDMLEEVKNRLGYRLSLDHLAQATLGSEKSADGLQALKWWAEGRVQEIIEYCTKDVAITRALYLHGHEQGFLLFTNKAKQVVRVPVAW